MNLYYVIKKATAMLLRELIMPGKSKNEIIRTVRSVLAKHPYILQAELFGSRQREDSNPESDVDLIIRFDQKTRPKGVELYAFELELEEALGLPVDVVQEQLLHDFVRDNIAETRELVYEKAI